MSQHHLQHNHLNRAWCVLGEAIYDDYANITIPRTINYTTGLANYFFRGRLSATAECIECNTIELTVTNLSDNSEVSQTLKGGTFELYWDASNGNRTQITSFVIDGGWTSSSTLAYNGLKTITFIKPTGAEPVKYVIVYKGNICQNPANTDSDDENAIAITTVAAPDDCCFGMDCGYCGEPSQTPKKITMTLSGIDCDFCWYDDYYPTYEKMVLDININDSFVLEETGDCYWSKVIPNSGIYYTRCNSNCENCQTTIEDGCDEENFRCSQRGDIIFTVRLNGSNNIDVLVKFDTDRWGVDIFRYWRGNFNGICFDNNYNNQTSNDFGCLGGSVNLSTY
jgi:hypothetical protein